MASNECITCGDWVDETAPGYVPYGTVCKLCEAKEQIESLSSQVQSLEQEVERLRKREALLELIVTRFQNGFDTMNGPKKNMGEVMEDIFRSVLNQAMEAMSKGQVLGETVCEVCGGKGFTVVGNAYEEMNPCQKCQGDSQ